MLEIYFENRFCIGTIKTYLTNMNHPTDELLDLVNERDEVIEVLPRSEVYKRGLHNFRAINVFIKNSQGQIWIPRRVATKRVFPLCLDMSVGGHVESGETYDFAFTRETQEELGLDITKLNWRLIGHFTPHEHGLSAFMQVYEIALDEVTYFNPDDFFEAFWLYPSEVLDRLTAGDISKDDLPRLIKLVYTK